MTEEELREKIAREIGNAVFACQNDPGWRTTESANQILTLIREAGYIHQNEDIDASAEILNKGIEIGIRMERERKEGHP